VKHQVAVVLLAGLLVREAFSFWTGHPFDFELWVRTGYWVDRGMSPYDIVPSAPGLSFANDFSSAGESTIGYLPFWPLLLGGIYWLYSIVGFGDRFVYYFLIKQPIIVADLLLGYLIWKYASSRRPEAARWVLSFWVFSPFTIIISSVWGMFDSVAMLPVAASLVATRSSVKAGLEGLAIWVKSIPLVYAIPLALSGRDKARNLALEIAIPLAGVIVPVLLLNWNVVTAFATLGSTTNKGGQSMSLMGVFYYLQVLGVVGSWPQLLLTGVSLLWIPATLAATILSYRWFGFATDAGRLRSLLLCTTTFMIFKAQVNEQYAIYLLALCLLDIAVLKPGRRWVYLAITGVTMAYLLANNVDLLRFISPLYPGAVYADYVLDQSLGETRYAALMITSIAFAALNVVYFKLIADERTGHLFRNSRKR